MSADIEQRLQRVRAGSRRPLKRRHQIPPWLLRCRRVPGGRRRTVGELRGPQNPMDPMLGMPQWPPRGAAILSCAASASRIRCGQMFPVCSATQTQCITIKHQWLCDKYSTVLFCMHVS